MPSPRSLLPGPEADSECSQAAARAWLARPTGSPALPRRRRCWALWAAPGRWPPTSSRARAARCTRPSRRCCTRRPRCWRRCWVTWRTRSRPTPASRSPPARRPCSCSTPGAASSRRRCGGRSQAPAVPLLLLRHVPPALVLICSCALAAGCMLYVANRTWAPSRHPQCPESGQVDGRRPHGVLRGARHRG